MRHNIGFLRHRARRAMPSSLHLTLIVMLVLWWLPTAWAIPYTFQSIDAPYPEAQSTSASDINDRGEIVGTYSSPETGNRGFLFSGETFVRLDVPFGTLTAPGDINNNAQVVGLYFDNAGVHGFLFGG